MKVFFLGIYKVWAFSEDSSWANGDVDVVSNTEAIHEDDTNEDFEKHTNSRAFCDENQSQCQRASFNNGS